MAITDNSGYQANVGIEWHAPITVPYEELGDECMRDRIIALGASTDGSTYTVVDVVLRPEYPDVNGFRWNSDLVFNLSGRDGVCTDYPSPQLEKVNSIYLPGADGGVTETVVRKVFVTGKNPNNPEGAVDPAEISALELSQNNANTRCTVVINGQEFPDTCSVTYPG